MTRDAKRILSIFFVLGLVVVLLMPGGALADWRTQASLSSSTSPWKVYIGVQTTFTYTLSNTGSSSFDVSDFTVHFDWQESGYVYDLLDSTVNVPAGSSKDFSVSITIPQATIGTHSATIIVRGQAVGDWFASTQSWTSNFEVYEIPPLTAVLSANPTSGVASLTVSFTSTVTGGLSPYSYSWSFGDGASSAQANPTHTFTSAGTYTVKLIVEDSSPTPKIKSDTTTITVSAPPSTTTSTSSDSPPPSDGDSTGGTSSSGSVMISSSAILILLALSVIVIIGAVALLAKSRKSKTSQPSQLHQQYPYDSAQQYPPRYPPSQPPPQG